MAELNEEDAFLASMGGEEYDPQYMHTEQQEEEEDEDDYDPSSFLPDDNNATPQVPTIDQVAPPTPALESIPTSADGSQAPSRTASRMSNAQDTPAQPSTKPVTVGGFIEEDGEEDDNTLQEPQAAGANGLVAVASAKSPSQAPPGSVSQTPVPTNVHVYNTPQNTTGVPDIVPNGAAQSVSNPPVSVPQYDGTAEGKAPENPVSQPVKAAPEPKAPASASITLPKARLPHDVVGQFEDRIKEDPKGDIDAWFGLIRHLRSKNKLDDVRQVYSRFFEVFPTTVSFAT